MRTITTIKKVLAMLLCIFGITTVNAQTDTELILYGNQDNTEAIERNAVSGHTLDITINGKYEKNTWYVFCIPFNITEFKAKAAFGQNVKVEEFKGIEYSEDGYSINFEKAAPVSDGTLFGSILIQAGKPYLIYPTKNVENYEFSDVAITATTPETVTIEADGKTFGFNGLFSPMNVGENASNILMKAEGNTLKQPENGESINGLTAYWQIPTDTKIKDLTIDGTSTFDVEESAPAGEPSLEVEEKVFELCEGFVGQTTLMGKIHVKAMNMPSQTTIEITGANRDCFTTSATTIAAGTSEMDIEVSYVPNAIGQHKGNLLIDCQELPQLSATFPLSGIAIDADNPPVITVEPAETEEFTANVGEIQVQTISIKSENAADYVYIRTEKAEVFTISSSMMVRNMTQDLNITFTPKKEGEYTDAIIITTYGAETLRIPLKGIATGNSPISEKEGDELKLDTTNPLKLMIEGFDNGTHNKPLQLAGWCNVAEEGTRAWWGYTFPESDISAGEKVAKVTPYDSKVEYGEETPCKMMLITPALDFKNADSKLFTFSVRGDYLSDNQTDLLQLYYLDNEGGEVYSSPVAGFTMPSTADESGKWFDYQIDLEGQDLADVFFMGFVFSSHRGASNTATYYIDNVSYGRTDLPMITPSVKEVAFVAINNETQTSDEIEVAAANLTDPITLTVDGANKSRFSLSKSELPTDGGSFTVDFVSDEIGVHEAYIVLSSKGAANKMIKLTVNNTTAISTTENGNNDEVVAEYDLQGRKINGNNAAKGIRIVKTKKGVKKIVK